MTPRWVRYGMAVGMLWCGLSSAVAQAATGYTLTYEITSARGGSSTQQTIDVAPDHARVTAGGQQTMLFDFPRRIIWVLDDKQRTAQRLEIQQLADMMRQTQGTMAQVMGSLPPEQRGQAAQWMQQLGAPAAGRAPAAPPRPQPTGRRETISGFPCEAYTAQDAGGQARTEWRTAQVPPEAAEPEFRRQTAQLEQLFHDMMAAIPRSSEMVGALPLDSSEGFVVRQESSSGVMTFQGISKHEVTASAFAIPAGYREVNMIPSGAASRTGRD